MRRGFSILLVLFFALGPVVAALQAENGSGLPACCRRHGQHRCAMDGRSDSDENSATAPPAAQTAHEASLSAPARCPFFPRAIAISVAPIHALAECAASLPESSSARLLANSSSPSLRTGVALLHFGRGPPSFHLG